MPVTYKDIDDLTAKASAVGTEKIVVSDTEYITPRQIAARATGLVANNVDAGTTQYVIAKTNLTETGGHRVVFEVIGNTYSSEFPFYSVIQATNQYSASAFLSGRTRAINMGKVVTYYVANIDGYICLYFQIDAGVNVWISCHSGGNLDNRVTEVTMQSAAPTYSWRATATNRNLSNYLPLSGGTMTGAITMPTGSGALSATGIDFGTASHIGSAASSLGLYSTGGIYICPGDGTLSATYGLAVAYDSITYNSNTVWHAGNFTPHNITISSSEPTSSDGSNGDIWIVI